MSSPLALTLGAAPALAGCEDVVRPRPPTDRTPVAEKPPRKTLPVLFGTVAVHERTAYAPTPDGSGVRGQRILLWGDDTLEMHAAAIEEGKTAGWEPMGLIGEYPRGQANLTFDFYNATTVEPWRPTGHLRGDSLDIEDNLAMVGMDLDGGVYVRSTGSR